MSSSDSCAWNNTVCEQLGDLLLVEHLSERDLGYNMGIDQGFYPGVSINVMGTEWKEMLQTTLSLGFKAFYMDFSWENSQWKLCPGNKTCASLDNVTSVLDDYIRQTDTNLEANMLKLSLRYRVSDPTPMDSSAINSTDLAAAIASLTSRILTPNAVVSAQLAGTVSRDGITRANRQSWWPSSKFTLINDMDRLLITTDTSLMPKNVSWYPLAGTAFDFLSPVASLAPISWPQEFSALQSNYSNYDLPTLADIPFRSTSIEDSRALSDSWLSAIRMGFSPVLNSTFDNSTLLEIAPYLQWLWAKDQPIVESHSDRDAMLANQNYSMCGLQTYDGLTVYNCHENFPVLCANNSDPFDWVLSLDPEYTVFTATTESGVCPSGYTFSPPVSTLERIAAVRKMRSLNVSAAWTPVNSLSVENCWVDSINNYCPYNNVQDNRNGVSQLAVVSAIAFGLLVFMVFLDYRHYTMPMRPQFKNKDKNRNKGSKKK